MKKLLLVAFVALFAFTFSSCSKEESLAGTEWGFNRTETVTDNGPTFNIKLHMTLSFVDETRGKMGTDYEVWVEGHLITSDSGQADFNYTFDGKKGTITNIPSEAGEEAYTMEFERTDESCITFTQDGLIYTFIKQ